MTSGQRKQLGKGMLFISPWLIGFAAFGIYPDRDGDLLLLQ